MYNQMPFFNPYNLQPPFINNNQIERIEEKIDKLEKELHMLENKINKLENNYHRPDKDESEPTDMYMI